MRLLLIFNEDKLLIMLLLDKNLIPLESIKLKLKSRLES